MNQQRALDVYQVGICPSVCKHGVTRHDQRLIELY